MPCFVFSFEYAWMEYVLMEYVLQVVMSNGLVTVTISNPAGMVTGIQYNGISNVLETANKEDNRGYLHMCTSSSL